MDDPQVLLALVGTLVTGFFGKGFLDRYLVTRQQHTARVEEAEQGRQTSVIMTLAEMAQTQNAAQIELMRDAWRTLQTMAVNMSQLAVTIEGQGRDTANQFVYLRDGVVGVADSVKRLNGKLDEVEQLLSSLVSILGERRDG